MVMDGISRIGIGLSGVCKARLVSWEKNHGETHEKPMISSKKNAFNPGISSNWWLVYLPPEEMEFVRLDHPNWAATPRCTPQGLSQSTTTMGKFRSHDGPSSTPWPSAKEFDFPAENLGIFRPCLIRRA